MRALSYTCDVVEHFRSQLDWRPYGHLICTPVCLLVGTAFLNNDPPLTQASVASMMHMSHRLYSECFASNGLQQLQIQELYELIPKDTFRLQEAAGMLVAQPPEDSAADDLLVLPLSELLQRCSEKKAPCCIIVTAQSHTMCYLTDPQHKAAESKIMVFDPLPASLCACGPGADMTAVIRERYGPNADSILYSAVVLQRQKKRGLDYGCQQ